MALKAMSTYTETADMLKWMALSFVLLDFLTFELHLQLSRIDIVIVNYNTTKSQENMDWE